MIEQAILKWNELPLRRKLIFFVLNVGMPLFIGGLLYILLVPTAHISEMIYQLLNISSPDLNINLVDSFISCYLSDLLWAYALFNLIFCIWVEDKKSALMATTICIFVELVVEFLQLTPIIDGTFDWNDIAVELFADFLACGSIYIYSIGLISSIRKTIK